MSPDTIITLAQGTAGGLVVMAFFITMFIMGYVVARPFYDDLKNDNAYLRAALDRSLETGERLAQSMDEIKRKIDEMNRQR
jgi:F0F1-type ATP synthase membrane subunit b/b'